MAVPAVALAQVPIADPAQVDQVADRLGNAFQATPTLPSPTTPVPVATVPAHEWGAEAGRRALQLEGATAAEVSLGVRVCMRESFCQLGAVNQNRSTRDDSWGPFQINYYGSLGPARVELIGPKESNTSSWSRAARNFLLFLRTYGACHWSPPKYCS